ncbi:MAG: retropepsin-like aspartic protease [Myxococcota bacterium]
MFISTLAAVLASVPCQGDGPGCSVNAKVGRSRLLLKVDTGADITVLSDAAARRAGVRLGPDSPSISIQGVNGQSIANLARVDIQIGAHEEQDIVVAVYAWATGSTGSSG